MVRTIWAWLAQWLIQPRRVHALALAQPALARRRRQQAVHRVVPQCARILCLKYLRGFMLRRSQQARQSIWYGFKFTTTKNIKGEQVGFECECPYHRGRPKCRRTRDWRKRGGYSNVVCMFKPWCLRCDVVEWQGQGKKRTNVPHSQLPDVDAGALPKMEELDASAHSRWGHQFKDPNAPDWDQPARCTHI